MASSGVTLAAILLPAVLVPPAAADGWFPAEIIGNPTRDRFSVCYDHSCRTIVTAAFSAQEWQRITAPLQGAVPAAAVERTAIADAIARMERIVGEKTGTANDRGGNLAGFGRQGQMDCIDESNNTTTFLKLLQHDGLLRFHRVMDRVTRFGLFAGMPHTTAVIRDIAGRQDYAVDSWFFDNGEAPVIMELEAWQSGWRPEDDQRE